MLEWDDLRFVLAICRSGTMNGAARSLHVNQTTVARRLGALEERLGVLLFDRTPDGFRVTIHGQRILPLATQMEEAALLLERMVAGSDEKLDGTVRLACSETLAIGFIVEKLGVFRAAHPGIAIEVVTGNSPINLLRREADVAVRTLKPTQSDLAVRKLASPSWYLYRAKCRPASALETCDAIGFEGELAEMPAAQWLRKHVAPERIMLRCNSILTARAAIRAGVGVGPLPAFLAANDAELELMMPEAISTNELWMVVHSDLQHQARVRAFIDFLVEQFAREAVRFAGPHRS